ncbi:hypothetical protein TVAG_069050 [Trichomonas vaginalis G3]|uniref:Cupin domain-containing protein n=1 Tax=Trichomonas vaginalis (strain ATCC PRA-98 / G3) TaxID=412133 RepID=A2G928_TRIV3|nr:cupin domain-containing protein family [Trichomonas vaginalis G3]EAX86344.1 hypothetical protein TVAG_069050 [Trichomonas vaginalis G3]KAI5536900.1 cupin domain-containing protein family [Trichomonas vaginalis G3]|eukprot:XP_001299274.1 hypothetical protein [Trichomonas vaginalis G3]
MTEERHFIVIHMMTSLDGKITGPFFDTEAADKVSQDYEWTNASYKPNAWICGRITFDENFTNYAVPELNPNDTDVPEGDFVVEPNAELYVVAADPSGKLAWQKNTLQYDVRPPAHIIEALTEKATPQYKNYLRKHQISYIVAGKEQLDWKLLVMKLKEKFNINVLAVEGGGIINWSFLNAGIVDELSICLTAAADGSNDTITLFEKSPYFPKGSPVEFELKAVDKIGAGGLWIRYTPKGASKRERPYLGQFDLGKTNDDYAKYFIGQSYLSTLSTQGAAIYNVTFEPGCRNNWHIHHGAPQTLLCTSGFGWYQEEGKKAIPLKPGDVVDIPPEVKHWHGARKDTWFSHISVQPYAQNTSTEWLEPVDTEYYNKIILE